MLEDKERESQVLEGEEECFGGGVDDEATQVEDDNFEKIQQIGEQELADSSKSSEMENKKTDGDENDDGLMKAQGIKEPERYKEESKIQEMVEEKTGGQEKINNKVAKRESDGKETQTDDANLEKSQQMMKKKELVNMRFLIQLQRVKTAVA
ncbi:unnamed protein product [Eruca vesicaria subsp. sativa]|uniref:Uncharacterized protein n=1 Tax=Eruca vesicaria subsp. sativa TaxID=29727 RepID=A0ABC8KMK2_ERUVS|nr:unnamed protein product [Eruca vesicaria subsp. sativa]